MEVFVILLIIGVIIGIVFFVLAMGGVISALFFKSIKDAINGKKKEDKENVD